MRLSAPVYQLKHRAKRLARDRQIPLNQALDLVARDQGFASWSLLAARSSPGHTAKAVLGGLEAGELILIAARPGHGKTRFGLELLVRAAELGRRAVLFTLELTEAQSRDHLQAVEGRPEAAAEVEVMTAPDISADYICRHLAGARSGTLAVIDYLQILDQRRDTPPLGDQLQLLADFAQRSGVILCFISQIDRAFDPATAGVPGLNDLRLPNPVDLSVFARACFIHGGRTRLHQIGRSN